MFFICFRVDKDVIDKDQYKIIQIFVENTVHDTHEGSMCIGKSKWCHRELIMIVPCSEICLMNILIFNYDLMIP
jgi:hypothetical protein